MLVKSQVKYIQSLGQKKFRDSEGVFAAEGPKIINELLRSPNVPLVGLFATAAWLQRPDATTDFFAQDRLSLISEPELERISFLSTPNQVFGIFKKPIFTPSGFAQKISLLLDGINDPGNMGTMIRIADWFGLQHVVCSADSADAFNPKTVQATMGSISRVQIQHADLPGLLAAHPAIPAYAAVLDGESLVGIKRVDEGFLVIGNESKGISPGLLSMIGNRITIPGSGQAESLNAAVAAGIVLAFLKK